MSWLYSRALVAEYWADTCSDGEPCAPSSAIPPPLAYCAPDKMTAFSRLSRSGATFAPLTVAHGEALLTWYLAGFPVKTLAPQARARESVGTDPASGWKWRESSVKFDHVSRSWKTRQCSLLGGSEWFSETWPRWGMMRDGECWQLPMSERPIFARGSGLLPTIRSSDADRGGRGDLIQAVRGNQNKHFRFFPTPTAEQYGSCQGGSAGREGQKNRPSLASMARSNLWRTPTAGMAG